MSAYHFITDGPKPEVMAGAGVGLMRSGGAPRTALLRMMTVAVPTTLRKACRMHSTATTSSGAPDLGRRASAPGRRHHPRPAPHARHALLGGRDPVAGGCGHPCQPYLR